MISKDHHIQITYNLFSNNVVISCTWYAIFVTENYEKWLTRIIMYRWCKIILNSSISMCVIILQIINNYKSYQKNHLIMIILIMISNHTNLYIFQLVYIHFMSCFVKLGNITDDNCTYEKYIYNSTQTEIYNMYRNSYIQFLKRYSIRNDLQRSSYTDHLQFFY